ncbi:MAG: S8 family serine peptidase [Candidatus Heimdallarchaeota archaeon]
MASKQRYNTTLWTIVIIFLVISASGILFLTFYIPQGTGGKGVKIAILDTGINMDAKISGYKVSNHLGDRVIFSKSFATTEYGFDQNYSIVDDTDVLHGTVIALTIAGKSDGIAPEAELIIGRCVDSEGTASYEALLAAFLWAVDEADADIVNISLGGEILYNDTVVEAINHATEEKGVLTVVSAGNSGDDLRYALSSINGPANALQAISVGAVDYLGVSYYSSLGPLKDHRIKPDLLDSGFAINVLGTSFAAPKIAAKAAVLLSWCREQGYISSPGLLKAALMRSTVVNEEYPVQYGGAGFPSVDEAKKIITDATKVNNVPILTYILPRELPFGISDVFQGDIWSFPLTIISSKEMVYTITSDFTGDSIISIASTFTNNQSGILNCYIDVPSDYTPTDNYYEQLTFKSQYDEVVHLNISVDVVQPTVRIGFDVYHSLWSIDHLLGQFIEMRNYLADESIALIEFGHPDNYTDLSNYDAVILPDPNSYGLRFNSTNQIENFYRPFSNDTITALVDFVNAGNGLFVLTTDSDSSNLTETNRLLQNFNITATEQSIPSIEVNPEDGNYDVVDITDFLGNHPVTAGLSSIDYYGAILNVSGDNSQELAWGNDATSTLQPVLAGFNTSAYSSGRVLVSGSNFMLDNWGINNKYDATDNLDFLYNAISWITNTTFDLHLSSNPSTSDVFTSYTSLPLQLRINNVSTINSGLLINTLNFGITLDVMTLNEEKKDRFFSF